MQRAVAGEPDPIGLCAAFEAAPTLPFRQNRCSDGEAPPELPESYFFAFFAFLAFFTVLAFVAFLAFFAIASSRVGWMETPQEACSARVRLATASISIRADSRCAVIAPSRHDSRVIHSCSEANRPVQCGGSSGTEKIFHGADLMNGGIAIFMNSKLSRSFTGSGDTPLSAARAN
jgi:hypothetical protein